MKKIDFTTVNISNSLLIKGTGIGFIAFLIVQLRGVITLPFYTRLLGPEGLGIFRSVLLTGLILAPFFSLAINRGCGISSVSLRDKKEISENFNLALFFEITALLITGALFLLWGKRLLPAAIRNYSLEILLIIFAVSFYEFVLEIPTIYQKVNFKVSFVFLTELSAAALSIVLLYRNFGISGAALGYAAGWVVISLVSYLLILSDIGYHFRLNLQKLKKYVTYSFSMNLIILCIQIIRNFDKYLVLYFLGAYQVGIYFVAASLTSVILGFETAFSYTYQPTIMRLWNDGEKELFHKYVKKTWEWTFKILAIVSCWFYILAKPLVKLFAGTSFSPAAAVMPILAASFSFAMATRVLEQMFYAIKKPNIALSAYAFVAAISIVLNWFLIPAHGIMGAAFAGLISGVLGQILFLYLVRRYFSFRPDAGFLTKLALITGTIFLAAGMSYRFLAGNILNDLLITFILTTAYFFLLWRLHCLDMSDVEMLKKIFKRAEPEIREPV